jgi:hypothetical protein
MPLGKNVGKNIKELMADNRKKGGARGAGGRRDPVVMVLAIALSAAGKSKPSRRYPKTFRIRTS